MEGASFLNTQLQKIYYKYIVNRLKEASEKKLTCRLTINIRKGIIDNLQEVNNIAGITITNYYLDK